MVSRARFLPAVIDNRYEGRRIALVFFGFFTAITLVRSVIHIVAPDGGAGSIATIPLASFSENGASAVIHAFALWGLSQLIVALVYIVALLRYRSLIPLLYALAVVEYLVRLLIGLAKPVELEGTAPGGVANYVLVPLLLVMLWLSLRPRRVSTR